MDSYFCELELVSRRSSPSEYDKIIHACRHFKEAKKAREMHFTAEENPLNGFL